MADSLINRAEELTAITIIAKEYTHTLGVSTSMMSAVVRNSSEIQAKVMVSQFKMSGWHDVYARYGYMSDCWYVHIALNTAPSS